MQGTIFVSHSRRNRAESETLVSWLRLAGLPAWISGPQLHCPLWQHEIFPHLERSAVVLVLASSEAAAADGVAQEIAYAKALDKPIVYVPVRAFARSGRALWPMGPMGGRRSAVPGTPA